MNRLFDSLPEYAKAIVGAVGAGLLTLAGILVGDMTLADLTQAQWLMVIIATLGVGGTVGVVPNKPNALQRENQVIAEKVKQEAALTEQVAQEKRLMLLHNGVDDIADLPDDTAEIEDEEEVDATPVSPDYQPKHLF